MLALLLLIGGASLGLSEKTVEASPGVIARVITGYTEPMIWTGTGEKTALC